MIKKNAEQIDVETRLKELIDELVAGRNEELALACKKLLKFSIGWLPKDSIKIHSIYTKGDEQAPFFSEAYLYNLLGKEDARTLLALMRPVWRAAGIPREQQP